MPTAGTAYERDFRVMRLRPQHVRVDVLSARRARIEMHGALEVRGFLSFEHRAGTDELRVQLDEAVEAALAKVRTTIVRVDFDEARDLARVRVRPGWLPPVTVTVPRVRSSRSRWLADPRVFF